MAEQNKVDVTITILTYNGDKYIRQILKKIRKQEIDGTFETLVIDSGSTDRTLDIVSQFPEVRLHKIPNGEFGHGKTRNLAAELSNGEIVVYLTHDAIPSHKRWLHELISPFEISPKVVGVTGKQIPRVNCPPMLKYEIQFMFSKMGPDFGTTVFYKDSFITNKAIYDAVGFYSDANSAARKSYLLGDIPYRDVPYAEDQLFGRDIIEKGLIKVYAPRGSVVHSNDLRLREYKLRMFDETMALRNTGILTETMSRKGMVKHIVRGAIGDSLRILRDRSYGPRRKLQWLIINPLFHVEKWRGVYAAMHADLNDKKIVERYSLEASRKE